MISLKAVEDFEKAYGESYDDVVRSLQIFQSWAKSMADVHDEHIEKMLVAYMLATDIHPADVVLVEQQDGLRTIFYFANKNDVQTEEHENGD